jgi:ABC-type transporter Mla MlaB component
VGIRIQTTSEASRTVIKIDGRLRSEDLDELDRVFRSVHGATALDLSDLQTADRAGVKVLREYVSLGAELRRASPYIDLLLKSKT